MLSGIVYTPFLRADGSICEQPGYDSQSGLLFKPDNQSFPPIPQQPSKADALAALDELEQLIKTFPFVAEADRAVALSALLTALDRRSMNAAPMHAFTSPTAGTGKSLLVDLCAILATGRPMPVISQGRSEEELEKRHPQPNNNYPKSLTPDQDHLGAVVRPQNRLQRRYGANLYAHVS